MQFSLGIASIDKPDSNGAGTFVNLIQIKFGCSSHSDQSIGPRSNRARPFYAIAGSCLTATPSPDTPAVGQQVWNPKRASPWGSF
jgi:hypothetical protein